MIDLQSILLCDFYKAAHCAQYDSRITKLVSYYVPRMSRFKDIQAIPVIGIQSFIKEYLIEDFNEHFFNRPIEKLKEEYDTIINATMGPNRNNWLELFMLKNKICMCMIAEIITFDGRKFKIGDHRTTSIKWSDRYGCFLINDSVRVYIENIKSLTCGDK